jgi:hypothetical protein
MDPYDLVGRVLEIDEQVMQIAAIPVLPREGLGPDPTFRPLTCTTEMPMSSLRRLASIPRAASASINSRAATDGAMTWSAPGQHVGSDNANHVALPATSQFPNRQHEGWLPQQADTAATIPSPLPCSSSRSAEPIRGNAARSASKTDITRCGAGHLRVHTHSSGGTIGSIELARSAC